MNIWKHAIRLIVAMTLLTGVAYPLAVTGLAKVLFKERSEGSLFRRGEVVIGSELISQKFSRPGYFWGRPSAVDFNPQPSGGSNLGPTSKDLLAKVQERRNALAETLRLSGGKEIPQDLLFASASGVDSDISPEAARFQESRVARSRNLKPEQVLELQQLVENFIEPPQWGILGQARVNVLKLNLALDKKFPEPGS